MNKLFEGFKTTDSIKSLLDEILHSLHIMIRDLLYIFYTAGIVFGKVLINRPQNRKEPNVELRQLGQWQLA